VQTGPADCELLGDVYRCRVGTLAAGQATSFGFTLEFPWAGSFVIELHSIGEHDIAAENDRRRCP